MSPRPILSLFAGLLVAGVVEPAAAESPAFFREQARIADLAFARALAEQNLRVVGSRVVIDAGIMFPEDGFWQGKTFGETSAEFSRDDLRVSRFHRRGWTVLDQLRALDPETVEQAWIGIRGQLARERVFGGDPAPILDLEIEDGNVVVNYLLPHLLALRLAARAGANPGDLPTMRMALLLEARAQAFLRSAFYAGHMTVPLRPGWTWLHPGNTRAAHQHFRNVGLYVIDSDGRVWQTFGDEIVQAHGPTEERVLEASVSSLREVLLAYFIAAFRKEAVEWMQPEFVLKADLLDVTRRWTSGKPEPSFYRRIFTDRLAVEPDTLARPFIPSWLDVEDTEAILEAWVGAPRDSALFLDPVTRLPTLLMIPVPVTASWSERRSRRPWHRDAHPRFHVPQLAESGLHDPDTEGFDPSFLYSRESAPPWWIPEPLHGPDPDPAVLLRDPRWASVRFREDRSFPPSYRGWILRGGAAWWTGGERNAPAALGGLAFGLEDGLFRISVGAEAMRVPRGEPDLVLAPHLGIGFPPPGLPLGVRPWLEAGYAGRIEQPFADGGFTLDLGVVTDPVSLGAVYLGCSLQAGWRWAWMDRTRSGPVVRVLLH